MRKAFILLVPLLSVSCADEYDTECHISTAPATAAADGTVTYRASMTGWASISLLVYRNDNGPIAVRAPIMPFEVPWNVSSGTELSISADGAADDDGNVSVGMTFVDPTGVDSFVANAQCQ